MENILIYKGEFEPLNRPLGTSRKLSIEEALKLKLKALPPYFKYVFLGDEDTLLVILFVILFDV